MKKMKRAKVVPNTPEEREMLQEVMEKMKDIPAFEDKKSSILACIDIEKSKDGELEISFE